MTLIRASACRFEPLREWHQAGAFEIRIIGAPNPFNDVDLDGLQAGTITESQQLPLPAQAGNNWHGEGGPMQHE